MGMDLTGGIPPREGVRVRRAARGPRDARLGQLLGGRRRGRRGAAPGGDRGGVGELGGARAAGERRLSRRPGLPAAGRRTELATRGARRAADRARSGSAGLPLRGAVRHLDHELRRASGGDVDVRPHGGAARRAVGGRGVRGGGGHGGATVDPGLAGGRGGCRAGDVDRRRPHGRPALRAAVPCRRDGARRRRVFGVQRDRAAHPAPGRAAAGRVLGPLLAVGLVPERTGLRVHRVPGATTGRRPSTRATCSTGAGAGWWRPG